MHDELKTIDDVVKWLEVDGGIKVDDKGAYVTRAMWKGALYTGPPMKLDGNENDAPKLYLEDFMLESMIIRFLKDGKAEEFSPVSVQLEYGYHPEGYSNHTIDHDNSSRLFQGVVTMRIEKNNAGDVRYDAELREGSLRDIYS
ncbi:MAG: hypothetical protein KKE20_00585 [Nanoarchaeota archaeon]|nr:hypothetical protein [Nanoarchaeota archaeon]